MDDQLTAVEQHLSDRVDAITLACETLIKDSNQVLEIYDKIYDCDDKPITWPSPDGLAMAITAVKKAIETDETISRAKDLELLCRKAAGYLMKNKAEAFSNEIILNKKEFLITAEIKKY